MRIDIMTLFPDAVEAMMGSSIIGRARERGFVTIQTHQIRDYTTTMAAARSSASRTYMTASEWGLEGAASAAPVKITGIRQRSMTILTSSSEKMKAAHADGSPCYFIGIVYHFGAAVCNTCQGLFAHILSIFARVLRAGGG